MISGFLVSRPFFAARWSGAPSAMSAYLRRRALRIVRAYWVALTVLGATLRLPGVFSSHWWVFYGSGQIYGRPDASPGRGVAWTLCVEVSFYLFLPTFVVGLNRLTAGRSPRTVLADRRGRDFRLGPDMQLVPRVDA